MDTNAKVFRNSSPTLGAELRGVLGGYFNYQATSFLRFIPEYIEKPEPSHVSHRPVKTTPAIPRFHALNEDGVVVSQQLIGNFEMEIPSLVIDLLMGFGNHHSCLFPSVRPLDSVGEPLLPHGKHILRLLEEAGVFYLHPLRGCQKGFAADINANILASLRQGLLRHIIAGEADIPFASRSPADGDSLNITLYRTGQPELKPSDIPDSEVSTVQFPTCLFEGETVIPISALETGESWLVSALDPAKETGIRFIKALKHFLQNLGASFSIFRESCFQFWKLFYLAIARYRAFILTVNCDALFKGSVVESTAEVKPVIGFVEYLGIRQKAILESLLHFSRTIFSLAHSEKGGKPYQASPSVSPALKCGVLDGGIL